MSTPDPLDQMITEARQRDQVLCVVTAAPIRPEEKHLGYNELRITEITRQGPWLAGTQLKVGLPPHNHHALGSPDPPRIQWVAHQPVVINVAQIVAAYVHDHTYQCSTVLAPPRY